SAPDNLRSAGLSCFGDFPYPTPVDPLLPLFDSFPNRVPQGTLDRKIRARVVEVTLLTLRPLKQPAGVHDQLPVRVELHVSPVHRTRRRPFEVYTFVGIPAAVTGTLELVLRGFPVGCAAKMSAPRVYDEQTFGIAHYPHPVLLLKLCLHTEAKVRRVTHSENCARFQDRPRKEETQKHQEATG